MPKKEAIAPQNIGFHFSYRNEGAPYLHKNRGSQVLVSIPPVARAARAAAGAENALIEPVLCGEKGQSGAHHGRDGRVLS